MVSPVRRLKRRIWLGRHVDVVRAGQIAAVGRTQEAEAVLQDLEHAVAVDVLAVARVGLEDAEDDVLLARAGQPLDTHGLGHLHQLVDRLGLEHRQVHRALGGRELGLADDLRGVYFEHLGRLIVGARAAVVAGPIVRIAVAVAVALSAATTATTAADHRRDADLC